MKNVLIIENDPDDFSNIKKLLQNNFNCKVFPENNFDFLEKYIFNLVINYKKNEAHLDYNDLDLFVKNNGIKYVLIDKNLSRNLSEKDGFGEVLYEHFYQFKDLEKVLKFTRNANIQTIYKTHNNDMLEDDIIAKLGFIPTNASLESKSENKNKSKKIPNDEHLLLKKYNNLRNNRNIEITLVVFAIIVFIISSAYHFFPKFDGLLTNFTKFVYKHYYIFLIVIAPFLFYQLKNRWETKSLRKDDIEIYKDNLDFNITLFFHQAITFSFGVSSFIFLYNIYKHLINSQNILKFSEYLFLTFLPILITLSFYFFYVKSLRNIIVDKNDTSFEEGTKLMEISKTFFISSLVSYLLVKVIEIISEKGDIIENRIKEIDKLDKVTANELKTLLHNNDLFQIIICLILIIILILFYLKIKHSSTKDVE